MLLLNQERVIDGILIQLCILWYAFQHKISHIGVQHFVSPSNVFFRNDGPDWLHIMLNSPQLEKVPRTHTCTNTHTHTHTHTIVLKSLLQQVRPKQLGPVLYYSVPSLSFAACSSLIGQLIRNRTRDFNVGHCAARYVTWEGGAIITTPKSFKGGHALKIKLLHAL